MTELEQKLAQDESDIKRKILHFLLENVRLERLPTRECFEKSCEYIRLAALYDDHGFRQASKAVKIKSLCSLSTAELEADQNATILPNGRTKEKDECRYVIPADLHLQVPSVPDVFWRIMRIVFTITTCKRLNLFLKTMHAFLQRCRDVDFVEEWFVSY